MDADRRERLCSGGGGGRGELELEGWRAGGLEGLLGGLASLLCFAGGSQPWSVADRGGFW